MTVGTCHHALVADSEDEREVLTSLPRSRPTRRSSKRGESPGGPAPERAAQQAKPSTTTPRARPQTKARPKSPPASARTKPATSSARAERPKRKPAEQPSPEQPPRSEATARPRVAPERKVPPAGYAAPEGGDHEGSPGPTEIVTTAIQAVAELAQIGISVGRQVLQSAFERLPKP